MNEIALKIAVKVIKQFEGCYLYAYPDPKSPLYKALSLHGMLAKYMAGVIRFKDLDENFQALDGKPWTVGYGETQGITKDTVWTQAQADEAVTRRSKEFMEGALKISPKLATMSQEKIAAVTSFCYNEGLRQYETSSIAREIAAGHIQQAADVFPRFNLAGGKIMQGLVNRRAVERNLFLSI